ncbi:hypothetical protein [Mycolicibacterium sphagni]|uniref:Uncharacterized protein n=1 Tax=Mycolicibacterium sphagni TaxID=1786 RepID=A0A255DT68_9MYCO|nr:hypothetical protein [Mycolicibacterium sphagni]OYN82659.1 hypothetical protein CG716_00055 [Mycolicibacterium sphagni]
MLEGSTLDGAGVTDIGGAAGGPAGQVPITGMLELVGEGEGEGETGFTSGMLGLYNNVAITKPRTTTAKIVITIPRRDVRRLSFSIFVIGPTGVRP